MRCSRLAPNGSLPNCCAPAGPADVSPWRTGRLKATFARAHSRDLSETVDHEAEKLHDASARGEVAVAKARAVSLAGAISQALGDIQTAPDSEDAGRQAGATLARLADRAGKLAAGL